MRRRKVKIAIYNRTMDDNSQFMNCIKCVYIIFMREHRTHIEKHIERERIKTGITFSGISFPINLWRDLCALERRELFYLQLL